MNRMSRLFLGLEALAFAATAPRLTTWPSKPR
jgi:hypothetical protein